MKKLLSIGALALTITTCSSMSVFAAESVGNRKEAIKNIAANIYFEKNVVKDLNIDASTPVNSYVKYTLIEEIEKYVTQKEVMHIIKDGYNKGKSAKEIFDSIVEINKTSDITTNDTLNVAKKAMEDVLKEFKNAYNNGSVDQLDTIIRKYFKVEALNGTLTYGKNSDNRLVVTLERKGQIVLQVSSENIDSLQNEIENKIHSWTDLKNYYNEIKNSEEIN